MEKYRLIRLNVLFIPPLILVIILYCLFSVNGNLGTKQEENIKYDIRSYISNSLLEQEGRIEFLSNIINPKWFLYSVKFQNNKKLAVQSDTATPQYLEYKTRLILLINNKETSIKYGNSQTVSHFIKRDDILKEFSAFHFSFEGDPRQIFSPNSNVSIQDSPTLGSTTYKIKLSWFSMFLTYFLLLVAWGGLILGAKPIFQFIYYGKKWWLKI